MKNTSPIACAALLAGLGGCGSLQELPDTSTAPINYLPLASTQSAKSTLGGVALKQTNTPSDTVLSSSKGSISHSTQTIEIDDGSYKLKDPDGFTDKGLLTDGVSALVSNSANGFSQAYDYVKVYNQAYIADGTAHSVQGIFGIVTKTSDMPVSGAAVYRGEAEGTFSNAQGTFDLDDGKSTVVANFESGSVNVTMDGFKPVSRRSGRGANTGFNRVDITGMKIAGNGFSGGIITTRQNNTTVDATGPQQASSAKGRFYGQDSANKPDEVGGISYLRGEEGTLSTIFVAD